MQKDKVDKDVIRMGDRRDSYRFFMGKSEAKRAKWKLQA